jgi:hypothetical protein
LYARASAGSSNRAHSTQGRGVWTYDRAMPGVDQFPVALPIEASYCSLVRATGVT